MNTAVWGITGLLLFKRLDRQYTTSVFTQYNMQMGQCDVCDTGVLPLSI